MRTRHLPVAYAFEVPSYDVEVDCHHGPARRLVIAYCFTPYVDTSGTVAAKRIRMRGEPVDVIQNAMDEIREVDPGLDLLTEGLIRRRAVLPTPSRFSSWASIEEWCTAGLAQVDRWINTSRADGDVFPDGLPWNSMYSRSHFIASHFLAALIKARYPQIEWEAELSDPCSADATGGPRVAHANTDSDMYAELISIMWSARQSPPESNNVFEWAEALTYALADEVVFTNANQATYMQGRCDDASLRERLEGVSRVAHHPQLPERYYSMDRAPIELEPGTIHIAYFGNFYGKQSPVAAVLAMADLEPELRANVRLHLFTPKSARLDELVTELDVGDAVRVEPFLPFLQFLEISRRMDILLVVDYPLPRGADVNPFLLSKWGDYRGSGTPVWGMLEETSVLSTMSDPAMQFRTPVGHRSAAAQLLSRLARAEIDVQRVRDFTRVD